jgi:hypothetical protein
MFNNTEWIRALHNEQLHLILSVTSNLKSTPEEAFVI